MVPEGGERIAFHGGVRENRDTEQVILNRMTCCRVKDVMIDHSVFFCLSCHEIAFITAGGNDRDVIFLNRGDDFVSSAKWFLDTNIEI